MKKNQSIKEIAAAILALKKPLVLSHYNPDADAYGSSCALTWALKQLGRQTVCINQHGVVPRYTFIPGVSEIVARVPAGDWDGIIACDCGDLGRVGDDLKPTIAAFKTIINIDHHISNDYFGHYNLVVSNCSSTAEIMYEIIEALGAKITPEIATCLFVGISGDTGSFRYSSTTDKTLRIAAQLVANGASPYEIGKEMYGRNSLAAVRLQADAMANLRTDFNARLAYVVVTNEMYKRWGASAEDTESLVERARDIDGVEVSALIRQDADLWKVSMRSVDPKYNVSDIAAHFGGGGHKVAAAFRWRRSLEELESLLLAEIKKVLGP